MCSHEPHDGASTALYKSPDAKGSHKRRLSNGTPDNSPARRSKRQRSSINLKEPSSSPTSDLAVEDVDLPVKEEAEPTVTKIQTSASVKVEGEEDAKSVPTPKRGKKRETVVKKEETETTVEKKPSKRGKKTQGDKESDAMPLAPRTQGLRMFVGAHVSAAKGVFNSITNSVHIGGNAFALFLKSQRKWDNPPLQDNHRDQFRQLCAEHKYDGTKHILPHGSYLVNLAQNDKDKAKQAYDSFVEDLRRCEALGITLYNFHPGSANQTPFPEALSRLADTLTQALSATKTVVPVLETMCGHGSTIGGSLSEFRDLLALIPKEHHSRIGICVDTCHSFAAGYDLTSPAGFKSFLSEFDELIGLRFLRALHLNDSKAPRGSKRDLHANIGTGFLGLRAFHNVMNEPHFEDLPMILETPIEQSDFGIWAREIKLLESLIGMDPDGEEFKVLEAKLAEEGRIMREKHQEQYERKLETEEKKKTKGKGKQKSLVDMMKKGAAEEA